MTFLQQYGPWALIVGGSEGIGAALARDIAEQGLNLLLVARNKERLDALADDIHAQHPEREIRTLSTDMSAESGAAAVVEAARELDIGLLIYNAGACSQYHNFHDVGLDFNLKLTTLNVLNKMRLVYSFGAAMRERRRGGIILMGSNVSVVGLPGFATYAATKAFSSIFSEGMWHEMGQYGVHLLGFVVAETATPAIARNYPGRKGSGADPADVARQALSNLAKGPIAYAENGAARVKEWASLPRDVAVTQMYENTAIYR